MVIYWVTGHMGIKGNEKAEEVVKEVAEKGGPARCPEQFASLTYIGRTT